MVNYMSALMSGACILFLFWSITHLVRKLVITDENNITKGQLITVMGSGLVGALAYTFSDTFWFSAVEGEVYAFSSLFTAVVFWLILKWEDVADQPHSDRWIILIAYLTGLSIGVHLLNLLCLPAIVLVYYYKKTPNATAKGSLLALFGSMVLVAAVLYGIVPSGSLWLIYFFSCIYILTMSGFGLIISNYSATMQQAMFVMFFFLMVFILMSGLFTPVRSMPDWAQWIAAFNPLTYFIQVMRMIFLKGCGLTDLWPQFGKMLCFMSVFAGVAVWSYRKTNA